MSPPYAKLAITILGFMFISMFSDAYEADLVHRLPGQPQVSFKQYAGYITVGNKNDRALFYYFVEAEQNPSSKPLVLWLNGGPGCSSVGVGAFSENGPFQPKGNVLVRNDYSWNRDEDFRLIVNEVPLGTTFTMVSDSCHSGGLIDKEKEQIGPVDATYRSLTNPERPRQRSSKSKFIPLDSLLEILREKTGEAETESDKIKIALFHLFGEKATSRIHRLVNTGCSVLEEMEVHIKGRRLEYDHEELQQGKQSIHPDMGILLSGCQTDETSADACPTGDRNKAYGAFSNAIQTILEQHGKAPIGNRELVLGARKLLVEQGYSQHPCLYCSDMNADAPFLY